MIDPQDKKAWCERGGEQERAFAGPLLPRGGAVMLNPAKAEDKYSHDLYVTLPGDYKKISTRFQKAEELYGIPSRSAITLNCKDVDRYTAKYPNILIVFDVDYGDYKRLCYATLGEIRKAIKYEKAKRHTYKDRQDDTQGNAKDSWVLDAEWFQEL